MFWKYYFSIKYIQIVYADEALACKIKIKAIGQIFEFMFFFWQKLKIRLNIDYRLHIKSVTKDTKLTSSIFRKMLFPSIDVVFPMCLTDLQHNCQLNKTSTIQFYKEKS